MICTNKSLFIEALAVHGSVDAIAYVCNKELVKFQTLFNECMLNNRLELVKYMMNTYTTHHGLTCMIGKRVDNRECVEYVREYGYPFHHKIQTCNTVMFDYAIQHGLNPINISTLMMSLWYNNYDIVDRIVQSVGDNISEYIISLEEFILSSIKYFISKKYHDGIYVSRIVYHLNQMKPRNRSSILFETTPDVIKWILDVVDNQYFPDNSLLKMCLRQSMEKMEMLHYYGYSYPANAPPFPTNLGYSR